MSPKDTVNTNATSGLVLHLAADCQNMGRASDAKRFLQTWWNTSIITQQNASEERGLRFRDAKRLRDDAR